MARRHPVTARLNGSVGVSLTRLLPLRFEAMHHCRSMPDAYRAEPGWSKRRAQLNATLTEDSGNSAPKQR
jgi:hypothetical protein